MKVLFGLALIWVFLCPINLEAKSINDSIFDKSIGDSIFARSISPDFRNLLNELDTIILYDITIENENQHTIFDWGLLQSGVCIIKLTDSLFLIKCYTNLPLNGIDTFYVPTNVIQFRVKYQKDNSVVVVRDKKYKPPITWGTDEILYTKNLWTEMVNKPELQQDIFSLTYDECGELLKLNYSLLYSILFGDKECIEYFKELNKIFPAINGLTLGEEYMAVRYLLMYYGYI